MQKKTEAQHQKNGTFRPSRHAAPRLPVVVPATPKGMGPKAQAVWKRITAKLKRAGIIADLDEHALRIYCEAWETYLDAQSAVKEHGILIQSTNKAGHTNLVLNPAIRAKQQSATLIVTIGKQFGLTPTSRTGIPFDQADETNPEEAELDRILGVVG